MNSSTQRPLMWTGVALLLGLAGGCGISTEHANRGAPAGTGFQLRTIQFNGEPLRYSVFVPHAYTREKRWPVIVFLHGVLESGKNGTNCLNQGLGPYIANDPAKFNFIAVFPQSPGNWEGDERANLAIACLDDVEKNFSTDRACVTLTGLSNGGSGTWTVGARHPTRFSALAPMCGAASINDVPRLTRTPIWCFHNSVDVLIPCGGSREMTRRIKEAGGNVQYMEFNAFAHDCWNAAYKHEEGALFRWMRSQRKTAE